jgi:acyl-coenzyme A synthetase/AMP-(fatty) acid ligase
MPADDILPPSIWSEIVDKRARDTPERVFCEILEDNWREKGSREITYAQYARAVNRACWLFEKEFGHSKNFDSFAYFGDNDLRYIIALVAAQKSQRTVRYFNMIPPSSCRQYAHMLVDGNR